MTAPNPNEKKPERRPEQKNDFDQILDYCKTHVRDVIAYVLIVLGIILLFFTSIYGGLLVGVVTGAYFSKEIVAYILKWKNEATTQLAPHHLVALGVAIAFFISAPAIFLGAAVVIGIRQLFIDNKKSS